MPIVGDYRPSRRRFWWTLSHCRAEGPGGTRWCEVLSPGGGVAGHIATSGGRRSPRSKIARRSVMG